MNSELVKRVINCLTCWQEAWLYLPFFDKIFELELHPSTSSVVFVAQEYSANRWYLSKITCSK